MAHRSPDLSSQSTAPDTALQKSGLHSPGKGDDSSSALCASPPQGSEDNPLRVGPPRQPPQSHPFAYGRSDLEPGSLDRDFGYGGSGMVVGPNHPFFRGGPSGMGDPSSMYPGGLFPVYPSSYYPLAGYQPAGPGGPPQAHRNPFGARWDPITPTGGPHRYGSLGEPDNDEFPPPGSKNMYM